MDSNEGDGSDWVADEDGNWLDPAGRWMAGRDSVLIEELLKSPEQQRWQGWGLFQRDDWESTTPFDLGDSRHCHVTGTHSNSSYADPSGCEICYKWGDVVIEIQKIRQRRAREHLRRRRMDP